MFSVCQGPRCPHHSLPVPLHSVRAGAPQLTVLMAPTLVCAQGIRVQTFGVRGVSSK